MDEPDHPAWLEKWVEDWKSVPRLIYWGFGFVFLVVAVIAAVSERHGPGGAWWTLLVAGVVILGLSLEHIRRHFQHKWALDELSRTESAKHSMALTAVQNAHKATTRELERERANHAATSLTPVSSEHLEQIKRVCGALADNVNVGYKCDYHDPESKLRNDQRFRKAIGIHCPGVLSVCDEWDDILTRVGEKMDRLEERIESEVDRRFAGPPWQDHLIGSILLDRIRTWARTPNGSVEPMRLQQIDSRTTQPSSGGDLALCGSWTVLLKKGGLTSDEVQKAQNDLNRFVDIAMTWSESNISRPCTRNKRSEESQPRLRPSRFSTCIRYPETQDVPCVEATRLAG